MDDRLAFEKSFSFDILSLKGSHSAKLVYYLSEFRSIF